MGLVPGEALGLVHLPEFEWAERQEQHSRWGKAFIPSVCVTLWGEHQETRNRFGLQTQGAYRPVENRSTYITTIVGNTSRKMCLGSVRVPKTGTYLGLECVNRGGR